MLGDNCKSFVADSFAGLEYLIVDADEIAEYLCDVSSGK